MKTAISLPDVLYKEAEKTAKRMRLPRSQLIAKALEEFISHHNEDDITERLNKIYNTHEQNEAEINDANLLGLRSLTKNDSW